MKPLILAAVFFFAAMGCEILEEDISNERVQVLAPADKAVVTAGTVDFNWRALQYAAGYELTVAAPSFGQAARIVADTVIWADSLGRSYCIRTVLEAGDYQWSVRAFNGGYASLTDIRNLRVERSAEPGHLPIRMR